MRPKASECISYNAGDVRYYWGQRYVLKGSVYHAKPKPADTRIRCINGEWIIVKSLGK